MPSTPKIAWPRYVLWARVLLATAAPVVAYLFLPPGVPALFYGLAGLYFVYALVVCVRGRSLAGMLGLLALFGDTVFFLILASYGTERMVWLASAFFLFLLTVLTVLAVLTVLTVLIGLALGAVLLRRWRSGLRGLGGLLVRRDRGRSEEMKDGGHEESG